MNILILGAGGREHALAFKIAQSPLCKKLLVAPGNPGTAYCATNLAINLNDFEAIEKACIYEEIDLLVVGPEEPLVKGIQNYLRRNVDLKSMAIIGPGKEGAQLEGSKAFAKAFMDRHHIPTAAYREFTQLNFMEGVNYVKNHSLPVVLKADGLAAGKGVLICGNKVEAISEFELMIQSEKFGEAGKKVVVEEFLTGIEISVFVLTDGTDYILLPEAKDYKRIGEQDTGPNTGGMGAISPVPIANPALMEKIDKQIIKPTIHGLKKERIDYCGFIFFGLIITDGDKPFVIEYNCRLGDPETEVVIPRINNDLVEILMATANNNLKSIAIETDKRTTATVVAVSGGYPGDFEKGYPITGIENISPADSKVYHMGTTLKDGKLVTNGGRVLCVTSYGLSVFDAVEIAKEELEKIHFPGKDHRDDIGFEFV